MAYSITKSMKRKITVPLVAAASFETTYPPTRPANSPTF